MRLNQIHPAVKLELELGRFSPGWMEEELEVGRNLPSGPSCGPGGESPGVGRGGKVTLVR